MLFLPQCENKAVHMYGACAVPDSVPFACAEVVAHACLDELAAISDCQTICSLAFCCHVAACRPREPRSQLFH